MSFFESRIVRAKSLCYYVFMKKIQEVSKKRSQTFYMLLMLVAAFFWGTTFVAQSKGAEHVGAYTYLAGRSWISFFLMIPIIKVLLFLQKKKGEVAPVTRARRRHLILGSLCCGFFLFAASGAQQVGIAYTTTAKSGFLTAMYVVLVPIFILVIDRHRIRPVVFACVGMSVAGLYLLCMKDGFWLGFGDTVTLLSAVLFTLQILSVSHFSNGIYGPTLAAGMFLVEAMLATVAMLLVEHPTLTDVKAASGAILYAAVFSGCVAYTLQVIVQKNLSATLASIAMCCESVFSAIAGWIILGQTLTGREILGCVVMFISILIASIV